MSKVALCTRARPWAGIQRRPRRASSILQFETYATSTSSGGAGRAAAPTRRAITVTTDDGRIDWGDLSTGEKAARTTQQSFNFLLVAAGAAGTIAVSYLLYVELFAADSKTRQFNQAVDRIKQDSRCRELLGPASKITAYGEATSNKWARARPLAHTVEVDRLGTTHLRMHFNVEGPDNRGVVNVHLIKGKDDSEMKYKTLSLHVPGQQVVYLENAATGMAKKAGGKFFGVQWSR